MWAPLYMTLQAGPVAHITYADMLNKWDLLPTYSGTLSDFKGKQCQKFPIKGSKKEKASLNQG